MKTIVIKRDFINGKALALDGIEHRSMRWSYMFDRYTIIFNSKKEAIENCKNHPCYNESFEFIMLDQKQLRKANIILNDRSYPGIDLEIILNLNKQIKASF